MMWQVYDYALNDLEIISQLKYGRRNYLFRSKLYRIISYFNAITQYISMYFFPL